MQRHALITGPICCGVRLRADVSMPETPWHTALSTCCRTFMGVMDIDPLRLLEDGIRSQIGARIARTAAATLAFSQM